MAKHKGNAKRGGRGGGRGDNDGGGGGGGGGRGRRGGRGRGKGRGTQGPHLLDDALDFNLQIYADANLEATPYGGGRGHAYKASDPNSEAGTPNRGRGRGFRGRGRGHPEMYSRNRHHEYGIGASLNGHSRGGGSRRLGADAPLTKLLHQDRPLLRPIVFVPSVLNPTLFDQDEALLKPGVEEVDDPTAAQVARVFSGGNIQAMESSSETDNDDTNDDDEEEEELRVVDFSDIAKLFEPTTKTKKISPKKSNGKVVEEKFTGCFMDNNNSVPASSLHQPRRSLTDIHTLTKMMEENLSATERSLEDDLALKYTHNGPVATENLFYFDTQPTPIPVTPPPNSFPSDDFDDDVIVYVAPHPRKGVQSPEKESATTGAVDTSQFTPYVRDASLSLAVASSSSTATTIQQQPTEPQPQTQLPSMSSFSFSESFATPEGKAQGRLRVPPVTTPRLAKSWKRRRGVLTKKGMKRKSSFRFFGVMREEAELHDPKQNERRRGDSDLEWGDDQDSGGEDDGIEGPSRFVNGNGKVNGRDKGKGKVKDVEDEHGMEVDSDLNLNAMQQFVGGLLGENSGQHVTMDDLMDGEQMRLEIERDTEEDGTSVDESGSEGSSEDEDAEIKRVLADEEAMLISEALEFEDGYEDEEEDDGSSDEDEDQTPRTSFQKRLERLRNQASSSKHEDEYDLSDDHDDYDDMLERYMILAEMDGSDHGYNKARSLFDILSELDDESEYFNHTKSKAKRRGADLPEDLKLQWKKDRLKKAAYKKARAQARLEEAADPLSWKRGGKKGRKAMLAAARLDPTINVIPNRIIDMVTLVQQIKRFINDTDGPLTMSLPPTNKATRKNIHEIALAFNLKSLSKGHGDARYTTLTKTGKTGKYYIDEAKIAKVVRRSGGMGARGDSFVQDRWKGKAGRGAQPLVPRHREGDEVGKAAPRLNSTNVGFRMLSMMGWSEGERIGVTGGLQDPLTATVKNTKLGLGAAK